MNTHTAGPWQTYGKGGVEPVGAPRYELNDGWIIADCPGPDAAENARLVAAAPLLLEAAQWALSTLTDNDEDSLNDTDKETIKLLTNAITRATGRERGK